MLATLVVSLALVDGNHHARRRPPQHLLGDVHLHRGGHRHRLRRSTCSTAIGRSSVADRRRPTRFAGPPSGPGRACCSARLTATGAFFVLMLTDFQGIREFGFVAGTAVFMAFVSMVTLFPAVLALLDRAPSRGVGAGGGRRRGAGDLARAHHRVSQDDHRADRGADARSPSGAPSASASTTTCSSFRPRAWSPWRGKSGSWPRPGAPASPRSRPPRASTSSGRSRSAFAALPSVAKVESVLMLVPDRQPGEGQARSGSSPHCWRPCGSERRPRSIRPRCARRSRRCAGAFSSSQRREVSKARHEVQPVLVKIDALLDKLGPAGLPAGRARARAAPGADRARLRRQAHELPEEPDPAAGRARRRSPELRHRYVGTSGRYLLRIHPPSTSGSRRAPERFVTDLRRVDPDVTGPPITSYEAIRFIRHGYFQGTLYALLLVVVVTAAILRSALGTALALAPLPPWASAVDARLHARLRFGLQSRQCVGAAVDHRDGGRVRRSTSSSGFRRAATREGPHWRRAL